MSEATNIEGVRRAIDAWNATDWVRMEEINAPDAVWIAPEEWPEAARLEGWEAIRAQIERLKEPWSEERIDVDEIEAAGDRVFVKFTWRTVGESSGVASEMRMYAAYTFGDGRVTYTEFTSDRAKALAAAGIEAGP